MRWRAISQRIAGPGVMVAAHGPGISPCASIAVLSPPGNSGLEVAAMGAIDWLVRVILVRRS